MIGHPLLFWADAPDMRVELLAGEPELLIKKSPGNLEIRLHPRIPDDSSAIIVSKETPTRLRVINILDEHRRIAAIVGSVLPVRQTTAVRCSNASCRNRPRFISASR